MKSEYIALVVVLVVLVLFYQNYYRFSYLNTHQVPACSSAGCEKYNVHREADDQEAAANILRQVTERNQQLLEHLEAKYTKSELMNGVEPTKNNRIDVISGTTMYYSLDPQEMDVASAMKHVIDREQILERVNQLVRNYDPKQIYEISPMNPEGVTSYTEDKHKLILCLRKKETDAAGQHELHDINTVMFVVLHELSHMMNDMWGHPMGFWVLFKFMLLNAVEINIYQPVDYAKSPLLYCGLLLTYNPLFDPKI
jgi:hypothetical protein